jgi:hypothetical protein
MSVLLFVIFNYISWYFILAVGNHLAHFAPGVMDKAGDYVAVIAVVGIDFIVSWYAIYSIINIIKNK